MSSTTFTDLPRFQQLQTLFAAHIRDPQNQPYRPQKHPGLGKIALEIEPRRLAAYEQLFFNNVNSFFSNLFPVTYSVLGETRWLELIREYMQKHKARTPLFHEVGQEFLLFLQADYQPRDDDPPYLLELAHYEWIELALLVDEQEGIYLVSPPQANLQSGYRLSPVAIPLAYQWPVDQISAENANPEQPETLTTLLAYRDVNDQVQFMALTPLLYDLLTRLEEKGSDPIKEEKGSDPIKDVIAEMAETMQQPATTLAELALPALDGLLQQQVLIPHPLP
ncbi:MAG: DUF2063 domain-containing protein [Thiomicrospira sp.]|nr:DUF2063 domain-containing protein [Thiomicrospira sp.]OIP94793.1 MAG: hypothetical protein AUK56_07645 [Thiomicrospira sp. CG2_30_44_34]PIQ05145.1 MAG: DUF2063 domain-containing protein [Piscirickettsiaceae bacterium CG18_big_fil_WC_8_21_14_2_50_44_103]PIU37740.1 MAG: DUF2063 domain-containing protein [Piscirickettsiaceae bacterium CG07_land_8_20_14_0_80_44_28]PIW78532.1 MAG: DUF2063 domain-containing protein [Piscirickettsiaceae bacterium CG_4_8_14_3_um_filter_44_38]PIZ75511.1 MAG: DUF2063